MSKMSHAERLAKRRESRTKQRNQEKEDMFIADYVKHKYPSIHAEALQVYEILFKQYPGKIDIRKTLEHRTWKNSGIPFMHPAMNIHQEVPPEAQMLVIFPEATTPNPEATTPNPEATTPNPEATTPNPEATTPNPEATTSNPEATTPNPEATTPNPEATTPNPEATTPNPEATTSNPEATTPNPEAATPEPQKPKPPTPPKPNGKTIYKDNMQLIIPLIKSPVNHPGVVTQTLQIITEETLQGNEQLPNLDEIDPEIIDRLIGELRADPDLGSIFEDMEQDAEFEGLGMDLDINTDTRLEDELNCEFW